MSYKGTTWSNADKQTQIKEADLPEWVHSLISSLGKEIQLLREENKKLISLLRPKQ